MAYNHSSFLKIVDTLHVINQQLGFNCIKILSVGYPDFVVTRSLLNSSRYSDILKSAILADQDPVMEWHKLSKNKYVAISLFEALSQLFDVKFYYCDIKEGTGSLDRNSTFISTDLNIKFDSYQCFFNLILDSGTSEHCFNIAQVFSNYHAFLAPKGFLYQWSPFLSPNHGFYSINPTLYHDLGRVSAFKVISLNLFGFNSYRAYFKCKFKSIRFRESLKFRIWPWEFSFVILNEVMLQKDLDRFEFPVQSKYLDM